MKKLRGRNAILTGASRGLGVYLAEAFAREGVNLALAARSADSLDTVRGDAVSLGVDAVSIPTDLSDPAQVATLVESAEDALGSVDILINNAGIELTAPYDRYPPEDIELALKVNLLAPMQLARAVLPRMLARGRGHIANISSLAGKIGLPCSTPYSATKAGLVMFTHSLRTELADTPVGTSVICPGFVSESGMYARTRRRGGSAPALLRPTTPAKVVSAVLKAIRRDLAEIVVNPVPPRPLSIVRAIAPGVTPHLHRMLGTTKYTRAIAEQRS